MSESIESQSHRFSTERLLKKSEVPVFNFQKYGGLRSKGLKKESAPGLPLVSIVTIVRNDATHLEKTMLSVLNQTYPNVEYIIIDGGSTDGTVDVIKKYEDAIDLWISEPDKGTHDAINKGINLITGEWVNCMHCGDYFYDNDVFEKVFLKNQIQADIVYGDFIGLINKDEPALFMSDETVNRFWQGMVFGHQAVFTKTNWARKFPFDTHYKVASDYDFFMKCLKAGAVFQKVAVTVFRVGTLGISSNHWLQARLENWRIARSWHHDLKTDLFHWRGIIYELLFRGFKNTLSFFGVYEGLKNLYRRTLKNTFKRKSQIRPLS